jgi:hypothetical protein
VEGSVEDEQRVVLERLRELAGLGGVMSKEDLDSIGRRVNSATVPEDVFENLSQLHDVAMRYKQYARLVHPDRFSGTSQEPRAKDVFVKLTMWKEQAETKIRAGTYGDRKPVAPPTPKMGPSVIKTPKREYVVSDLVATGDLADVYKASFTEDSKTFEVMFKVSQSPADNDLLENESRVLTAMYPKDQVEEKFYRYLPKLYDTFALRSPSRTARRVNILQRAPGYFSLAEIKKEYPRGIDFRDFVWMYKRLLAGIGYVHQHKDVVHGAILPSHVLVHPTEHGAKIVDWSYAVPEWSKQAGKVKALSKPYKALYAPEILDRKPPTPETDLYMASKCAVFMLGGNVETNQMPDSVPRQVQAFFSSCLLKGQSRRPGDAWKLHEEFDDLLQRLVGPRKYRPLSMPTR